MINQPYRAGTYIQVGKGIVNKITPKYKKITDEYNSSQMT